MQVKINQLPPKMTNKDWVGVDLEMFDMNPNQLHRPTNGNFALLSIAHKDDVYLFDNVAYVASALERINDSWWIMQNAKFDITHLRRWTDIPPREKLWDTMLVDKILWGGYYDTFALDDLVRRNLCMHMDKTLQKSFSGSKLSAEQLEYSAKDAWILSKIVDQQKKHIKSKDFKIWNEIDRPAMFAFMDFIGFAIDLTAWERLAIKNKNQQTFIDSNLPINPRSSKQVSEFLQRYGYDVKSTSKEVLEKLYSKIGSEGEAGKVILGVLDSRMYGKRASTYGLDFLSDFIEYENDIPIIVANYSTIGAGTGRTSSDSPNMQNIPSRETKDFRECFVARPGHKLIVIDYSQQEILIAAYISEDERLINICNSGKDIYILMAKEMFGKDIDKQDPLRAAVKAIVLGLNYGMSEYGLARRLNVSVDEAKKLISLMMRKFPRLHRWMELQQSKKNFVETVAGRKFWLNPYTNKSDRNALNSPVQGSAGDCMKKSLVNLHAEWHNIAPIRFGAVGYVHDELVLDVPSEWVNTIALFAEETLVNTANTMFPGMKFRAEVAIGDNWACK